jgi:predicted DNA binding CopG/RHH family protein
MLATLDALPDLRPEQLDGQPITIRVSTRDREALERAAVQLGVPASRLLRALMRKALAEEAPAGA